MYDADGWVGMNCSSVALFNFFCLTRICSGVLQMQGGEGEGVLPVLRAPDNAADAVPPEQIRIIHIYIPWLL